MTEDDSVLNIEISEMSRAQLIEMLEKLRENRKKGYETPPRTRKNSNPFSSIPENIANKILNELKKK